MQIPCKDIILPFDDRDRITTAPASSPYANHFLPRSRHNEWRGTTSWSNAVRLRMRNQIPTPREPRFKHSSCVSVAILPLRHSVFVTRCKLNLLRPCRSLSRGCTTAVVSWHVEASPEGCGRKSIKGADMPLGNRGNVRISYRQDVSSSISFARGFLQAFSGFPNLDAAELFARTHYYQTIPSPRFAFAYLRSLVGIEPFPSARERRMTTTRKLLSTTSPLQRSAASSRQSSQRSCSKSSKPRITQ
jgi:hypothetical protein